MPNIKQPASTTTPGDSLAPDPLFIIDPERSFMDQRRFMGEVSASYHKANIAINGLIRIIEQDTRFDALHAYTDKAYGALRDAIDKITEIESQWREKARNNETLFMGILHQRSMSLTKFCSNNDLEFTEVQWAFQGRIVRQKVLTAIHKFIQEVQ